MAASLAKVFAKAVCAFRRFSSTVLVKDVISIGDARENGGKIVKGWIRGIRKYKDVTFLDVNDGSSAKNLQIVASTRELPEGVSFGSSVEIHGNIRRNEAAKQTYEMEASSIQVIGGCDNSVYPLKYKARHTPEYTRQLLHLRPRTNAFAALLRIRHSATMAFHSFFTNEGFLNLQTPVLTSNDCEGAGDLFTIRPANAELDGTADDHFFDKQTYLTVSGQLHLETICCSHGRVYSFNPAFRAENSRSRRHLAEFSMVEAELPFTKNISDITNCMEVMLKKVTEDVFANSPDDIQLYNDHIAKGHRKTVEDCLKKPFITMSYKEAVHILQQSKNVWEFKPEWGADLQTEHEKYLVAHCGDRPVFVVDYPSSLKAFYALSNDDEDQTVSAVDLLVPEVGELIGGTLREHRLDILEKRLTELEIAQEYQWYLDLRRFGSIPHGGFGVGFERYLLFLLGVDNIRDVIPFPRATHSCPL